jgi:hypothetical protein
MMHSQKDLICEIDQTIDQLIENAKVIETIAANTCYEHELHALEKTQESLIAHLIHMDEILKKKSSFIDSKPLAQAIVENKLSQSCYLKSMLEKKENLEQLIAQKDLTKPKIHKRKVLISKCFKT